MTTIRNMLVDGDPLHPMASDTLVQFDSLPVGKPVPEGWRVLSGNNRASQIARVILRCDIEEDDENA